MRVCITAAKQEEGQNIEGGMILLAHKDVDPVLTCTSCSLLNPTWTCFFVVILMIQTPVCSRSYSHPLVTSRLCPERQFSLRHLLPYLSRWLLPTCHGLGRLGRCSSKAEKTWENLCTSFIIFPHLSLKSASWSQFSEGTQEDCLWQMFPFSRFLFAVC